MSAFTAPPPRARARLRRKNHNTAPDGHQHKPETITHIKGEASNTGTVGIGCIAGDTDSIPRSDALANA